MAADFCSGNTEWASPGESPLPRRSPAGSVAPPQTSLYTRWELLAPRISQREGCRLPRTPSARGAAAPRTPSNLGAIAPRFPWGTTGICGGQEGPKIDFRGSHCNFQNQCEKCHRMVASSSFGSFSEHPFPGGYRFPDPHRIADCNGLPFSDGS